jgi:hypothetical protein
MVASPLGHGATGPRYRRLEVTASLPRRRRSVNPAARNFIRGRNGNAFGEGPESFDGYKQTEWMVGEVVGGKAQPCHDT